MIIPIWHHTVRTIQTLRSRLAISSLRTVRSCRLLVLDVKVLMQVQVSWIFTLTLEEPVQLVMRTLCRRNLQDHSWYYICNYALPSHPMIMQYDATIPDCPSISPWIYTYIHTYMHAYMHICMYTVYIDLRREIVSVILQHGSLSIPWLLRPRKLQKPQTEPFPALRPLTVGSARRRSKCCTSAPQAQDSGPER